MITSAASSAKELVDLAERMGISTEDAVHRVVMPIVVGQRSEDVVRAPRARPAEPSVRRRGREVRGIGAPRA